MVYNNNNNRGYSEWRKCNIYFVFAAKATFAVSTRPLALDPAVCTRYIKKLGSHWA